MSRLYENPMAPPGYENDSEPVMQLYKPLDPRMQQFRTNENFVSLLDLLDESLLETPPDSEEETNARKEKIPETKQAEMQYTAEYNPIKLEKVETFDTLNAFIAEYKKKSMLSEKEAKDRSSKKQRSKHHKQSKKLGKSRSRHKNKTSFNASAPQDPLISSRSSSQSSTSSIDRSSKHHRSTSPQQSTRRYKSHSSKRPTSPRYRLSPRKYSSSHRSIHTPSRSPSPARSSSPQRRTSPSRRSRSHHYSSSHRSIHSPSRSPRSSSPQQRTSSSRRTNSHHYSRSHRSIRTPSRSPTSSSPQRCTSPSRRSHSHHYSSSRRSFRTPSRSLSPARSPLPRQYSPRNRMSDSHQYSSYRKSCIRTPSPSPSFERSPIHCKPSSYGKSSKRHSSSRNKSPSYQKSLSPSGPHAHSPERSSNRSKSYKNSFKLCPSPLLEQSLSHHGSPERQLSLSPHKSPSHQSSSIRSDKLSNHPKSSVDEKSKPCISPNNKSLTRPRKFPIKDEYSKMLALEMKKKQIWDGSDLEEEPAEEEPAEKEPEKAVIDAETATPVKKEPADHIKDPSQNAQNSVEIEIVGADKLQSNSSIPKSKSVKQEIKTESPDEKGFIFNSFYCSSCQLSLNSEVTWQSHITGKRHAKILKMQTVHEVAKGSIAIPSTPVFQSEDAPRFGQPAPGRIRRPIVDTPRIQPAIDETRKCPLLGLQSVCEIRSEMEVAYYCELCDAPCSPHTIMPHLIGYKHQLRFLREIDPECYERNKTRTRKEFEYRLNKILFEHQRRFGRGQIKVFEEWDSTEGRPTFEAYAPGPSWKNSSSIKKEKNAENDPEMPSNDECLDTSKSDFYCKLCDAHMNNIYMWESHVRGKRHLKNAKKIPGENISKVRSVKAPSHVVSKLDKILSENAQGEIIVGLDSIRETHGPNGENYTCFPCGSNCTNFDIVDHLLLTKHRIRYLEKLVAEGKPNGITTISQMEIHDEYFRKHLIDDECFKMMQLYGSGTAEVYLTKSK